MSKIMTPTEYFTKRNEETPQQMCDKKLLLHPNWCLHLMQDYGSHIRNSLRRSEADKMKSELTQGIIQ